MPRKVIAFMLVLAVLAVFSGCKSKEQQEMDTWVRRNEALNKRRSPYREEQINKAEKESQERAWRTVKESLESYEED